MSATTTSTSAIVQQATTVATALVGGDLETRDSQGSPRESRGSTTGEFNNPSWWPIEYRRMPHYRPARRHPQWSELTASTRESILITIMFGGCHLLAVSMANAARVPIHSLTFNRWLTGSLVSLVLITSSLGIE